MARIGTSTIMLVILCAVSTVSAVSQNASVQLAGLAGQDVELVVSLYDNSGVIGDSWALIDNVMLGPARDDFEDGGLGGFDGSLNPASVAVVSGSLDETGSYVMQMSEDPVFTPTIAYRDYISPDGAVLSFDFEMVASDTVGFWGADALVVSLLDPQTLEPLVPGLTGFGDILAVDFQGMQYVSGVTVTSPVPVPGSLLLTMLGVGFLRLRKAA